jgi:F plasmid transfer operon protein TraF
LASWRSDARGIAVAYPALGLSYYRLRVSAIQPIGPIADGTTGRQDQGLASVRLNSLVLQQFGATVGQSIGAHLVVGSTMKLVRGAVASAAGTAGGASLDQAADLEGDTQTHLDVDIGAMAKVGVVRAGVVVKNVRQPAFGAGDDRLELSRRARAGVAVALGGHGATGPLTVAFDADLTRTPTATGDQRHIAGGAEGWLFGRSLGLRGGVSANTIGDARPTAGGGVSLALRSGTYVDGQATFGSDRERRGWGLALRLTF